MLTSSPTYTLTHSPIYPLTHSSTHPSLTSAVFDSHFRLPWSSTRNDGFDCNSSTFFSEEPSPPGPPEGVGVLGDRIEGVVTASLLSLPLPLRPLLLPQSCCGLVLWKRKVAGSTFVFKSAHQRMTCEMFAWGRGVLPNQIQQKLEWFHGMLQLRCHYMVL